MKEFEVSNLDPAVAQAIQEMQIEQGDGFSLEKINLAELGRRTGISRHKLRRMKENGFVKTQHGLKGRKAPFTLLTGYTAILDDLLRNGIVNSTVCLKRLQQKGFPGGQTILKEYIASHQDLVPAKRCQVSPQGSRGRRYTTEPGEAYQMDWGFTKVLDYNGNEYNAACFAMICHHCGQRYVEFFPNAKQENLFIGMVHAFQYMGIPQYILTDNMKSVVLRRDSEGRPVWQPDYEEFMGTIGFQTKLCKPRHPFTKGKVERLIRFVKDNFLAGRVFWNVTDLNYAALEWCNEQNSTYHQCISGVPQDIHFSKCAEMARMLQDVHAVRFYLCPERRISFDGFVTYEGRRFGVPYAYHGKTARVMRDGDTLYIYSADLLSLLTTHNVTWSRRDSFCDGQYETLAQPEEFPTAPVKTAIKQLKEPSLSLSFEKFNFDKEDDLDD